MGLATWAFMPQARAWRSSSAKALAVMAMMGMVPASGRSIARIARAASWPFITGICTSMKIMSKVPGALIPNFATASSPLAATSQVASWMFRMAVMTSAFRALSSATRTCLCARAFPPVPLASPARFPSPPPLPSDSSPAGGKSRSTMKVLPVPNSLSTEMVPPIRSTRFFVMAMPRPVP